MSNLDLLIQLRGLVTFFVESCKTLSSEVEYDACEVKRMDKGFRNKEGFVEDCPLLTSF